MDNIQLQWRISMEASIRNRLFHDAKQWMIEAGEMIRQQMHNPLEITTKSHANDLVTTLDREVEDFLVTNIKRKYPSHSVLGEEGYGDHLNSLDGCIWIIDPIDGTMNFVHQKRSFAISIGIYDDGIGEVGLILDVMSGVLYSAKKNEGAYKNNQKLPRLNENLKLEETVLCLNHRWLLENSLVNKEAMERLVKRVRGTRTYGSAALEFAYVAEGILGGYVSMSLAPWDVAAGAIIVNEVGGITTNIHGEPIHLLGTNSILTCHPAIQHEIIHGYFKANK